jgi:hypothetical protein
MPGVSPSNQQGAADPSTLLGAEPISPRLALRRPSHCGEGLISGPEKNIEVEVKDEAALAAWDAHGRATTGKSYPRNRRGGWHFPSGPAAALNNVRIEMSDNLLDPLLVLLRRHEEANTAFDRAVDRDASEAERDHLFAACVRTMEAIVDRAPSATTAEGAVAALDHVLNDVALWHGSAGDVFLRHLIEAARYYIIRTSERR